MAQQIVNAPSIRNGPIRASPYLGGMDIASPLAIAIDGPAASGKGTIARRIAARRGLRHLDTGLLYRAVAVLCMAEGIALADDEAAGARAARLEPADLERADLRSAEAGRGASVVAAHGAVRAALLDWQRAFARVPPGAVLDGRDIGTVVLPGASAKLFVTADPDVRAARRWRELSKGRDIAYRDVLHDIEERDARDAARPDAPMRRADDAALLDTTDMTIDQAVAEAERLIAARLGS